MKRNRVRRTLSSVRCVLVLILIALPVFSQPIAPASLVADSSRLDRAIAKGKEYRNYRDFLHKGLADTRYQIASAWAKDGISKYVTFYDDLDVISAAAATAEQQMREFTPEDLQQLPTTGLIFANVELHGRGMVSVAKLNKRYTEGKARLVLRIGGRLIQPVRDGYFPSPPKTECYSTMYLWSVFWGYRFAVAGLFPITLPCGPSGPSKFSLEFAYALQPEQMTEGEAFLIDANGHRHVSKINLARFADAGGQSAAAHR